MRWAACARQGERERQEDAFAVRAEDGFAVVADGMGGHENGHVASAAACDAAATLGASLANPPGAVSQAQACELFLRVSHAVAAATADVKPRVARGGGSTMVCAWVRPLGLTVAHVGDSRAYLVTPAEGLRPLTRDHNMPPPRENVLTRMLGGVTGTRPDVLWVPRVAEEGSALLLCTDGLVKGVADSLIARTIASYVPVVAAEMLADAAASTLGSDNVTVVILSLGPRGFGEGA